MKLKTEIKYKNILFFPQIIVFHFYYYFQRLLYWT